MRTKVPSDSSFCCPPSSLFTHFYQRNAGVNLGKFHRPALLSTLVALGNLPEAKAEWTNATWGVSVSSSDEPFLFEYPVLEYFSPPYYSSLRAFSFETQTDAQQCLLPHEAEDMPRGGWRASVSKQRSFATSGYGG